MFQNFEWNKRKVYSILEISLKMLKIGIFWFVHHYLKSMQWKNQDSFKKSFKSFDIQIFIILCYHTYYICRLEWGRCKFFSRKIKEYVRLKFGEKTIKCVLQSKCLSNLQLVVHLLNLFSCAHLPERLVNFFC